MREEEEEDWEVGEKWKKRKRMTMKSIDQSTNLGSGDRNKDRF